MANNAHFDLIAPLYERVIRPPDPERLRQLLDLPGPGWLLDAGGGTGRVAALLCPWVERLVISDLSQPMLGEAADKANDSCLLALTRARVERLPFADGAFARILVVDALHHFSDQPGALHELARVLRPGGRMVVEEPDIRRLGVKLVALAEKLALMGSRFRSPQVMQAMVAGLGLEASVGDDGQGTAWVVGVKKMKARVSDASR
jgi:demethylmenaquinone methyltransferase/2-methoxy-6-polyprenyl-1,4-benzoquinol methylase